MGSLEISVIGLAPPCGRIQGVEKGAEFSCIKFVEPAVATCLCAICAKIKKEKKKERKKIKQPNPQY